jgi:hypothetical protein
MALRISLNNSMSNEKTASLKYPESCRTQQKNVTQNVEA